MIVKMDMGWSLGYDIGWYGEDVLRWRAPAIEAGVDFIASGQYEDWGGMLKPLREMARGGR